VSVSGTVTDALSVTTTTTRSIVVSGSIVRTVESINDDLIKRSADICWPDDFDPVHADLFAHNAIVINAPAKNIWAMLIASAAWPYWYSNATDVVVDDPSGDLAEDVTFSWTTFGLNIASKVAEFVPYERLGWYGNGDQLRAYHTWQLIPRLGDSTYVVMEEIGMGDGARHLARINPGHMYRGHDLWNISLKFVSEA
jgi:hypothetical protein